MNEINLTYRGVIYSKKNSKKIIKLQERNKKERTLVILSKKFDFD